MVVVVLIVGMMLAMPAMAIVLVVALMLVLMTIQMMVIVALVRLTVAITIAVPVVEVGGGDVCIDGGGGRVDDNVDSCCDTYGGKNDGIDDRDDRFVVGGVPLSVRVHVHLWIHLECLCAAGCLNWTRRSSASSTTTQTVAPSRTASPAPSFWNT